MLLASSARATDAAPSTAPLLHEPAASFGSSPTFVTYPAGGAFLFLAKTPQYSNQECLWITDGTESGTRPLPDCIPFSQSWQRWTIGDRLFFPAPDAHGRSRQLWFSDGSFAGTHPLTSFDQPYGVHPLEFAPSESGPEIAFLAAEDYADYKLWVTEGTIDSTRPLGGPAIPGEGAYLGGLRQQGDRFLFFEVGPTGQLTLWVSDFTPAGTHALFTFAAGMKLSSLLMPAPQALLMMLYEAGCGQHLWRSDGTVAGTYEIRSFAGDCSPLDYDFREGRTYFHADDRVHDQEMWTSDGTTATRVTDLVDPKPFADVWPWISTGVDGGGLYFRADGGPGVGVELFHSTGTPESTRLVRDVCPGDCSAFTSFPGLTVAGGKLFFSADDGVHGAEPWMSDGTAEGTTMLADLCSGACSSARSNDHLSGSGYLLRTAQARTASELWRIVVADGSMSRIASFPLQTDTGLGGFAETTGGTVFTADDGVNGLEPWVTDGTAAGTHLLKDIVTEPPPVTEPPGRPHGFAAQVFPGVVRLGWEPSEAGGAVESWVVEGRSPQFEWMPITTIWGGYTTVYLDGLTEGLPYTVRLRGENSAGSSPPSDEISLTPMPFFEDDPCASGEKLCLAQRFLVEVSWRNQHAGPNDPAHGEGVPVDGAGTDRSGYFWFFKPDNIELVVKVLDGSEINQYHWTFYGALSDVEYWITVTDLASFTSRTYHNPPGRICGRGDTESLRSTVSGGDPASRAEARIPPAISLPAGPSPSTVTAASHPAETCVPDGNTLCLLAGRFRVRVAWQDQHNGGAGSGDAIPYSDRTGFFTFFNPANVELVVKALDGGPVNGKYWFFYGALSDVGYTITVEDLVDGHGTREYVNPPGRICGQGDTAAF